MPGFELAQVNLALPRAPLDVPLLAGFVAQLDEVNGRAEAADGFLWRLKDDDANDATAIAWPHDARMIVNMSVWVSLDALRAFVYGDQQHKAAMRRRGEWFERLEVFQVLWWVPTGHRPGVPEADERLARLRGQGPTPDAFTFRESFPAPEDSASGREAVAAA